MRANERQRRKTLLLIKGEALRIQLGLEIGMVRRRLSFAGLLRRLLPGVLTTLLGAASGRDRGGWRLARWLLAMAGSWRTITSWLGRS